MIGNSMKMKLMLCGLVFVVAGILAPGEEKAEKKMVLRAVTELSDGSRIVGTPLAASLKVDLKYAKPEVPLTRIRECEIRRKEGQVTMTLQNGDSLTGVLEADEFPMETIVGRLVPAFTHITRIRFSVCQEGALPAGEGSIAFGGVNWMPWRTLFEVQGDKLASLPKVRPGFNYGHSGGGRGPVIMTNIGNADWRDYSVEFVYCMSGVDPIFNPNHLPLDYRGGCIMFHVVDAKENWNQSGGSGYSLGLSGDGSWALGCSYNHYCRVPVGYGNPKNDGERKLAEGKGLKIDPKNGNKFRIELLGTRIQIWMDGERIADVRDEKMNDKIGEQTLDHGGVGFSWGHDSMGWIRNFSAKKL